MIIKINTNPNTKGVNLIVKRQSLGSSSFEMIPIKYEKPVPKGAPYIQQTTAFISLLKYILKFVCLPKLKMSRPMSLFFWSFLNKSPNIGMAKISKDAVATPKSARERTNKTNIFELTRDPPMVLIIHIQIPTQSIYFRLILSPRYPLGGENAIYVNRNTV